MAKDPEEDPITDNNQNEKDPLDPKEEQGEKETRHTIDDDPTKIHLNRDVIKASTSLWAYLRNLFSIKKDVNKKQAEVEIRDNITFAGINVWVLICSIIVASVGLMSNSIPTVIGAMLISPLMGPIRGMGLGTGIYDFKLVLESLKNFGVMTIIAIVASFLFFLATPFQEITPELLARTHPDFRDVLVAFFGGLAGIVAASKGKLETVVAGVAIATALMPPLCTAGFALSIKEWEFFFGAFYLFLLNSIFICLSTYLFVRYLKFPVVAYVNERVEKKVRIYTIVILVLLIIPAGYSFYKVTLEGNFNKKAQKYVHEVIYNSMYKVEAEYEFGYGSHKSRIEVKPILGGATEIPEAVIVGWRNQMVVYDLDTSKVELIVFKNIQKEINNEQLEKYSDLSKQSLDIIGAKDFEISRLNTENAELKEEIDRRKRTAFSVNYLEKSLKVDYPDLENFIISYGISFDRGEPDTIYTFIPTWNKKIDDSMRVKLNLKLSKRIRFEIHDRIGEEGDSVLYFDNCSY
ncbi:MAG: TIGR00341 family protein [Crocinitomicaceae bacterium]|nr:TIGR00341 family protein [Crocinitomicaceae bacterium]